VLYFLNDGAEEVYLGSADWMVRNLNRRVEVVTPVEDPGLKKYLKEDVLEVYLRDNTNARELQPDGSYVRVTVDDGAEPFDSQMYFEGIDPNI
jgi:polyphosphate kinase